MNNNLNFNDKKGDSAPSLSDLSIKDFLIKLASSAPAPGGGASSALSAAQACALFLMVAELTLNNSKYTDVYAEFLELKKDLDKNLHRLMEEMDRDASAFSSVIEAWKMPKNTKKEISLRKEAVQEGYKKACQAPLGLAKIVVGLLAPAALLVEKGNITAITDVATGIMLLESALKGASYNVLINLKSIKDPDFKSQSLSELKNFKFNMEQSKSFLLSKIDSKLRGRAEGPSKKKSAHQALSDIF